MSCLVSEPGSDLLFRVVFLVCENFIRGKKLVFYYLAVANLSDPLENDLVVLIKSPLAYKGVLHFVLDQ
jgi:hypothetical protein